MSELKMSATRNDDKKFDPHPEGTFMAVCRDIYIERKANPKAGQKNQWGNVEPEILNKCVIEFLTDEPIELNGTMYPRFIRKKANNSWNEKASLRAFVSQWSPKMGKMDECDLETLVGAGAYITVEQSTDSAGNVWSNIATIAAPPKGASIPRIPAEFVRHKDKGHEGATTNDPAGEYRQDADPFKRADEQDLNF